MNTAAEKIKDLRIKKGWTLETLAKMSNTHKSYIWDLENKPNKKLDIEKLTAVAKALSVTPSYLVATEIEAEPPEKIAEKAFFRNFNKLDERDKKFMATILKALSQGKR